MEFTPLEPHSEPTSPASSLFVNWGVKSARIAVVNVREVAQGCNINSRRDESLFTALITCTGNKPYGEQLAILRPDRAVLCGIVDVNCGESTF
jgi:hypothetical protein